MRPASIGIIGGAGPMAGAYLLERVLTLSSKVYGCYRDADFPKIMLINYPFTEMLTETIDVTQIQSELSECLNQLRTNEAAVLAIACNTLHAFLREQDRQSDLIHLPCAIAEEIPKKDKPLVFCTSISAQFALHKKFFACDYPEPKTQAEIDHLIDLVLQRVDMKIVQDKLENLIKTQAAKTIVLGCTELSLFTPYLSVPYKLILDPLEVAANKILEKSFANIGGVQ